MIAQEQLSDYLKGYLVSEPKRALVVSLSIFFQFFNVPSIFHGACIQSTSSNWQTGNYTVYPNVGYSLNGNVNLIANA